MMNRCSKSHYILGLFISSSALLLLAISGSGLLRRFQYSKPQQPIMDRNGLQPDAQMSSKPLNTEHKAIQLRADEFSFNTRIEFPPSVLTDPDKYAESITQENNGALDIILISQSNGIRYLMQVSEMPSQSCKSDMARACQQGAAAPARGNVAEIQFTLPGSKLLPGSYPFGKGNSATLGDVMIFSRQLYSDPSHGKLGCAEWGKGTLIIKQAVYSLKGNLERLEASLSRECKRVSPFPPVVPQDHLTQVEIEEIKGYIYQADWSCQF
jgi:hypothetical protein